LIVSSDHELFKSKGVAHVLQRLHTDRTSLQTNESSMLLLGRESALSSSISHLPLSTIENPITNLQEYCRANMLPIDIKTELYDHDSQDINQRKL